METTRRNSEPSCQRALADELLAPDPGPTYCTGDRWYRDVTSERALAAAERRHAADLRRRYIEASEWADYSVHDLRLPMTHRQTNAAAVVLAAALLITVAGIVAGSAVVTFAPVLLSAPVSALVVRDVYRKVSLWLLER